MEVARLTGVKIAANEKEISDLDAEYRALAEQTRLTPTPHTRRYSGSKLHRCLFRATMLQREERVPLMPMNSVLGSMMRWVLMCVRTQSHRLCLTLQNGKKRCVPIPTLHNSKVNFGQYESLHCFVKGLVNICVMQKMRATLTLTWQRRSPLLSGDTGDGSEIAQEG